MAHLRLRMRGKDEERDSAIGRGSYSDYSSTYGDDSDVDEYGEETPSDLG